MIKKTIGNLLARGFKIALIGIAAVALIGEVITQLWNWLMPALFALPRIGYWQALGLLLLSKLFFSGFGGRRGSGGRMGRWGHMTPEERAEFRKRMQARCRPGESAAPAASQ